MAHGPLPHVNTVPAETGDTLAVPAGRLLLSSIDVECRTEALATNVADGTFVRPAFPQALT